MSRSSKDAWLRQIFGGAPQPDIARAASVAPALPAPTLEPGGAAVNELKVRWKAEGAQLPADGLQLRWQPVGAQGAPMTQQMVSASTFQHTITGLNSNTEYMISIASLSSPTEESGKLRAMTLPEQPHNVVCTRSTGTSLDLAWQCAAAAKFVVYGSAALRFAKVYTGPERRCTINELTEGCEYGFRVCAFNSAGGASAFSEELLTVCTADETSAEKMDTPSCKRDERGMGGMAVSPAIAKVGSETSAPSRAPAPFFDADVDSSQGQISGWDSSEDGDDRRSHPSAAGGVVDDAVYGEYEILGGRDDDPLTPQLLTLTHESLSMRWSAPPGQPIAIFLVDLAEITGGYSSPRIEDWSRIYEGAPPGCEVSFLEPLTTYHLRVAVVDTKGEQLPWGPVLSVTTAAEPPLPVKEAVITQEPPSRPPQTPRQQPAKAPHQNSVHKSQSSRSATQSSTSTDLKVSATRSRVGPKRPSKSAAEPPCQTSTKEPTRPAGMQSTIAPPRAAPRGGVSRQPSPRRSSNQQLSRPQPTPNPRHPSPRRPTPSRSLLRKATGPPMPSSPRRPTSAPPRPSRPWADHGYFASDGDLGSGSSVHDRLYAMHATKMHARHETRQSQREQRLALSNSPRRARPESPRRTPERASSSAFGSSAPRGELWAVGGCPTRDGSRTSSSVSARNLPMASEAGPGPGEYDVKSTFKTAEELRKSVRGGAVAGANSAFKSKTARLLPHDSSPRMAGLVRESSPADTARGTTSSFSVSGHRRRSKEKDETPGPGAYAPDYDEHARSSVQRARPSSVFASASPRIGLPWHSPTDVGGGKEESSPGPGSYDTRDATPRSARRIPTAFFGRTTTPRFGHEVDADDLPPPPGAYFCN